jgi:hypothetical protein
MSSWLATDFIWRVLLSRVYLIVSCKMKSFSPVRYSDIRPLEVQLASGSVAVWPCAVSMDKFIEYNLGNNDNFNVDKWIQVLVNSTRIQDPRFRRKMLSSTKILALGCHIWIYRKLQRCHSGNRGGSGIKPAACPSYPDCLGNPLQCTQRYRIPISTIKRYAIARHQAQMGR